MNNNSAGPGLRLLAAEPGPAVGLLHETAPVVELFDLLLKRMEWGPQIQKTKNTVLLMIEILHDVIGQNCQTNGLYTKIAHD